MASIINRPNGHRWIQFVDHYEKRQTLRLGKTSKKHATEVCRRVESLLAAKIAGDSIDRQTAKWLETTEGKIRERLANLGLAEPARERRTLGDWLVEFKARHKSWKKSSIENFDATKDSLIEFFGESRMLDTIKPHDAEDFRMWMLTEKFNRQTGKPGLADDTVRRRCGRSKSLFKEAIKRGYCTSNPFESIVSFTRGNAKRQFFVDASIAYDCIEASPCTDWRTTIALCRFGGLRCPTEIVNLDWVDVNLPEGFMILRQPKVEHHDGGGIRVCPIFPELRPYLEAAWDAAPEGAVHVINRYRDPEQNLRTTFQKIIERAGHKPWPRLFQNLRATRETELLAKFPAKDVTEWIGNSVPVAMNHYAMATKASFESAKTTPSSEPQKGEAKSEAVGAENAKQKPKQHRAEKKGAKSQKTVKRGLNRDLAPLVAADCDDDQLPGCNVGGDLNERTRSTVANSQLTA